MKMDINIWKKSPLFQGIEESNVEKMLFCLGGIAKEYKKNEWVIVEGESVQKIGIMMEGCVQVISEDVFGNRNILEQLGAGEIFGAAFASAELPGSPVAVVAVTDSRILQIDVEKIFTVCSSSCPFHQKLIRNMVHILARKNILLSEKINYISKRTTKEKLLAYLSAQSKKEKSRHFTIPFNRQELADYLCVERSAMSAELSRLRTEGVLEYKKSEFWLM